MFLSIPNKMYHFSSYLIVRNARLKPNERLRILVIQSNGITLLEPALYTLNKLRGSSQASNITEQVTQALIALCSVLEHIGIDLAARLSDQKLFEAWEIEEIARICYFPINTQTQSSSFIRTIGLINPNGKRLTPETAAIRMHYICDYLNWLVESRVRNMSVHERHKIRRANVEVIATLSNRATEHIS